MTCRWGEGSCRSRSACARCGASATRARSPSSTSPRRRPDRGRAARCGRELEDGSRERRARRRGEHRRALRGVHRRRAAARRSRARPTCCPARAAELVARAGGRTTPRSTTLLADDAVDTVVNLTAPSAHAEVTAALPRGGEARPRREAASRCAAPRRGGSASTRAARRPAELLAGDAARRGAADGVEARPRRLDRPRARRLRRGELGPDRALAPRRRVALRGRGRSSTSASTR